MAKSAQQHLEANKQSKIVVLEQDFAGIRAGSTMFVGTPKIVNDYINAIPAGETRTVIRLKNDLARKHRCDAMCPVSTAIFIRISAQAAVDQLAEGKTPEEVTPFWRLLTGKEKIAKKLTIDPEWLDQQRASEAST